MTRHFIQSLKQPIKKSLSGEVADPLARPDPADNPLRRTASTTTAEKKLLPPQQDGLTVLGIDPGSQRTGWGIIRECSGVLTLIKCGVVRPRGDSFSARLGHLFQELAEIVSQTCPHEAAIENVHMARNAATALKLGQARGVAVAACSSRQVPVFDWQPTEIKQAVTGTGKADKEQVAWMVAHMLNTQISGPADITDALAVAVCHLNRRRFIEQ